MIGKAGCCSKKRTILKFDVCGSQIPYSATILNAQNLSRDFGMKLYYYSASNGGSGSWVDVGSRNVWINC